MNLSIFASLNRSCQVKKIDELISVVRSKAKLKRKGVKLKGNDAVSNMKTIGLDGDQRDTRHFVSDSAARILEEECVRNAQIRFDEIATTQGVLQSSISAMIQQLQSIAAQIQHMNRGQYVLGELPGFEKGSTSRPGQHRNVNGGFESGSPMANHSLPRLEFPRFDGDNPRAWIKKCNRYFQILSTIAEEHKVPLASIYMEGKAEMWYQGYMEREEPRIWEEFVLAVLARFEDTNPEMIIGHKCKQRQIYLIMTKKEEMAYCGDVGVAYGQKIQILIDSGSTHCFLDENTVQRLGCVTEYTTPMMVSVADGGKMISRKVCPKFVWGIQGQRFEYPVKVIKLGGCAMVLGGD
ncbi:hypothetical protein BUALT_Bualt03G0058500 [Buddleja alternifolia]|uniref:Uncharacterized protein n=1 Tax=Buddleja alternifolia TaxID=168488 RepID=A0AAV6XRB4_9LAMI|nr:hypothetical protein BUALT_Bualt03G0058500 [Buddleja alternifolia]